jgi:hypothetical protein
MQPGERCGGDELGGTVGLERQGDLLVHDNGGRLVRHLGREVEGEVCVSQVRRASGEPSAVV